MTRITATRRITPARPTATLKAECFDRNGRAYDVAGVLGARAIALDRRGWFEYRFPLHELDAHIALLHGMKSELESRERLERDFGRAQEEAA